MPKMRWQCETNGCFNQLMRPKIEVFDQCFPRAVAFGDVDAIVEMGSKFLLLEWKSRPGLKGGQAKMYQRLPLSFTTLVIVGNAESMEVSQWMVFCPPNELLDALGMNRSPCVNRLIPGTLEDVQEFVYQWGKWADGTH